MTKSLLLALVAAACLQPVLAHAQAADPEAHYQALLTAAKSGTAPIDWTALRYAYADRPSFFGALDDDDRATMFHAAHDGDWAGTLMAANKALDAAWIDGGAHLMAAVAQTHLGNTDAAAKERALADGIFASIRTGDGLKPETAFTVIAVSEEYDLLDGDMGVTVKSQSLNMANDHQYDVMTVTDADGKEMTYYFNIDREWAAEGRMFGKP